MIYLNTKCNLGYIIVNHEKMCLYHVTVEHSNSKFPGLMALISDESSEVKDASLKVNIIFSTDTFYSVKGNFSPCRKGSLCLY